MNARTPELAKELMMWFQLRNIAPNQALEIMIRVQAIAVIACSYSETDATKVAVTIGNQLSREIDTWFTDHISRELDDLPPEGHA